MENKETVTFDTNFMIENKVGLRDTINSIKEIYKCIIFDLVIEEIKGQKIRDTLTEYNNIIEKISQAKERNDWLKIDDKTNIELEKEKQEKVLDKWMNITFEDNIIKFDNKLFMEELLERSKYKKPPFNKSEHSSDKGFKDTLIFLSLKRYSEEIGSDIFFITNDKGFINNKEELEQEFFEETNNKLTIISGSKEEILQLLGIKENENNENGNDESEKYTNIFPEAEQTLDLDKFRDEFLTLMKRMFYFVSFSLYSKMDISNVEYFINKIKENMDTYIFCEQVNGTEILNVGCDDFYFSVEDLRELIKKYETIKNSSKIKEAFLYALLEEFNKFYTELPF